MSEDQLSDAEKILTQFKGDLSKVDLKKLKDAVKKLTDEISNAFKKQAYLDFVERYQTPFKDVLQDNQLGNQDEEASKNEFANNIDKRGKLNKPQEVLELLEVFNESIKILSYVNRPYDDSDMELYDFDSKNEKHYNLSRFKSEYVGPLLQFVQMGLKRLELEIERLSPPPQKKGFLSKLVNKRGEQNRISPGIEEGRER